jgi:hypothetical protein
MNLATICNKIASVMQIVDESEKTFETISIEELGRKSESDKYAEVVKQALEQNGDIETELYLHQYQALYALAEGKDVILSSPCGSGKTRVLENTPLVAKLGFELSVDGGTVDEKPVGIICCTLTAIIEDKIKDDPNSGMISMYGSCQTGGSSEKDKGMLSKSESEFLFGQISYIYGHPESFTTEIGKKILETNEC